MFLSHNLRSDIFLKRFLALTLQYPSFFEVLYQYIPHHYFYYKKLFSNEFVKDLNFKKLRKTLKCKVNEKTIQVRLQGVNPNDAMTTKRFELLTGTMPTRTFFYHQ